MELANSLPLLFAPSVTVAAGLLRSEVELGPSETMRMLSARHHRRIEFASGRSYAREALAALGLEAPDIAGDARHGPDWPAPAVGSISHAGGFAAAVVALKDSALSLGLDIEVAVPLPERLVDKICLPSERAGLASPTGDAAKLLFVMKEAVYKAYAPMTGVRLGFHEIEVRADWAGQRFQALVAERGNQPQWTISGRFARLGGLLAAGSWIPPTPATESASTAR